MATIFFRIVFSPGRWFGPGKAALLEAIDRTGSISAGAKVMGMSYRRAWQLVDDVRRMFRTTIIESSAGGRDGGGARLTPTGRAVVRHYRSMERHIGRAAATDRRFLERLAPSR